MGITLQEEMHGNSVRLMSNRCFTSSHLRAEGWRSWQRLQHSKFTRTVQIICWLIRLRV